MRLSCLGQSFPTSPVPWSRSSFIRMAHVFPPRLIKPGSLVTALRHRHVTKLSREYLLRSRIRLRPGRHAVRLPPGSDGKALVPLWRADSSLVGVRCGVNTRLCGRQAYHPNLSRRCCLIGQLFLSLQISRQDALKAQCAVYLPGTTIFVPVLV